jgi:hypothetical protein
MKRHANRSEVYVTASIRGLYTFFLGKPLPPPHP